MEKPTLKSLLGPEFSDLAELLDQDDSQAQTGEYFLEQAHLLYGDGLMLCRGQVAPFVNFANPIVNKNIRYVRHHILMRAYDGEIGPVFASDDALENDPHLSDQSRISVIAPDSPAGFFGNPIAMETGLRWRPVENWLRQSDISFRRLTLGHAREIFPTFHIEVSSKDFRGESMNSVAERLPVRWMFNVETQQMGWYLLIDNGPLFFPVDCSFRHPNTTLHELQRRIASKFAFYPIYIGMPGVFITDSPVVRYEIDLTLADARIATFCYRNLPGHSVEMTESKILNALAFENTSQLLGLKTAVAA